MFSVRRGSIRYPGKRSCSANSPARWASVPHDFPERPSPCVRETHHPDWWRSGTGRGGTATRFWSGCRSRTGCRGNPTAARTGATICGVTARAAFFTSRYGGHWRASRPSPVPLSLQPLEVIAAILRERPGTDWHAGRGTPECSSATTRASVGRRTASGSLPPFTDSAPRAKPKHC